MKFWFCDKCGSRVTHEELPGSGETDANGNVYCAKCAPKSTAVDVMDPPSRGSSRSRISIRTKTIERAAEIKSASPSRPRSDTAVRRRSSNALLYAGLSIAAGFGAIAIFLKTSASSLIADNPKVAIAAANQPAVPAQPAPPPATVASTPASVPEPPGRTVGAPPVSEISSEARAQAAFSELEKRLKQLDDKDRKVAAIDAFLEQHGDAIVTARARTLRDSIVNPPAARPVARAPEGEDLQAVLNRTNEMMKKSDFAGVIAEYDRLIKLNDQEPVYFQNRAEAKRMSGDYEGVLADADRTIALNPKIFGAWALRAIACFGLKKQDDFRESLSKAAAISGVSDKQMEQKLLPNLQRARIIVEGAAFESQAPATAQEFLARGEYRLAMGKGALGSADLKEALERDSALAPQVLGELAAVARSQKKFADALKYYKQWAESKPVTANALNAYAWELLTCEDKSLIDPRTALPAAEKAAELSKKSDAAVLDTLALAYFKNNRVSTAIAMEEKALAMLPSAAPQEVRSEFEKRLADFKTAEP